MSEKPPLTRAENESIIVTTPYSRAIAEIDTNASAIDPTFEVNPYKLFCLTSRLQWFVNRSEVLRGLAPSLVTKQLKNRMVYTVELLRGGTRVLTTVEMAAELQAAVDEIVGNNPNYCLLLDPSGKFYDKDGNKVPKSWLESILRYVQIDSAYDPYIDGEREGFYVDLQEDENYNETYDKLHNSAIEQIMRWYDMGALVVTRQFKRQWHLNRVPEDMGGSTAGTDENLFCYHPEELPIQQYLPFLLARQQGLSMEIPLVEPNFVSNHFIALELRETDIKDVEERCLFSGASILLDVQNTQEVRIFTDIIARKVTCNYGRVATISLRDKTLVPRLQTLVEQLFPEGTSICYRTTSRDFPYIFSCTIPLSNNSLETATLLRSLAGEKVL